MQMKMSIYWLDKRGAIIKYAYGQNETFFRVSTPILQK